MLDGQRIDSVLSSEDDWFDLKKSYRSRSLVMTCGLPAFPRTSNLGLRHFVHKRDVRCGNPECWAETAQHRAAKTIVARAVDDAGWQASIEHQAADGTWTADVLAEKDGRSIAFEIQWSKQGSPDFASRQKRYEDAGVECFWFVHRRNRAAAAEAGVPHLIFDGDGLPLDVLAHEAFQEDVPTQLALITQRFLDGGYLDRVQVKVTAITLELTAMECFACHEASTVWRMQSVDVRTRCQQIGSFKRRSYGDHWPAERVESIIQGEVRNSISDRPPLAPLRMHFSRQANTSYLAYGCAHCSRGFFGDYFIITNGDWDEVSIPVSTRVPLAERLLDDPHICEDLGFGRCSQTPHEHSGPVFGGTPAEEEQVHQASASVQVVGDTISMEEALYKMTGVRSAVRHSPAPREAPPPKQKTAPAPGKCDLCGTDPHPEFDCLWRQLRALLNVPEGRPHYSDDIRARILLGDKPVHEGTELLRRCLQRSVPLPK